MAIKKLTSYKAAPAAYWRINIFSYDDINDTATIHLWLYVNEEAKNENLQANGLKREIITVTGIKEIDIPAELSEITNLRDILKTLLYLKIKESKLDEDENETNWFVDAESV